MIKEPTVFVLGAGASKPYGFPLAAELTTLICSWIISGSPDQELHAISNVSLSEAREMARRLHPSQVSIDLWLAQNKEFLTIGRYSISRFIAKQEEESTLFWNEWYAPLFRKLLPDELPASPEELCKNSVTFVTFNYDRSLEQALLRKTQAMFGVKEDKAAAIVSTIPIIHVHGQIGPLPWQKPQGSLKELQVRPYQTQFKPEDILSMGIKIVSETSRTTPEYDAAQKAMLNAKYIYFLGFGYDPQNLMRLKFRADSGGQIIQGTHHELPEMRKAALLASGVEFGMRINFDGPSSEITSYFRNMIGS